MKFTAKIDIMPLKHIHCAEGAVVERAMRGMGHADFANVRVGKHLTLEVVAKSKEDAMIKLNVLCGKLLHCPDSEGYDYQLAELSGD